VLPFLFRGRSFAVVICTEIVTPGPSARAVAHGAGMLVNVTNDAWFRGSAGHEQHLMHAVLRAVENRVSVIRVANTGSSAVIAPDGEIRWRGPVNQADWKVTDVIVQRKPDAGKW